MLEVMPLVLKIMLFLPFLVLEVTLVLFLEVVLTINLFVLNVHSSSLSSS